jgi:chromosome partitioning protein
LATFDDAVEASAAPSWTLILGLDDLEATELSETSTGHRASQLGWPDAPSPELSTGLGWPAERSYPQDAPLPPQVVPSESEPVVSRETTQEARPSTVRTAADLAESGPTFTDDSTPLARAAEHVVLARQGARMRPALERPDATRVVVVANQKGGVGKTTSTVNIAAALAQLGQRVLVIDLDPQGNASTALGVEHRRGVPSTYDALVEGVPLVDVMAACPDVEGLVAVPATIDLAGAEIELVSVVARESRLARAITAHPLVGTAAEAGDDRFDYVFIDCPPSLGLLTLNALVAGAEMMIPIQAEYYALEGLGQLLETVEMVKKHLNQRLVVSTILVTMYDGRTRLASGVADEVREHFPDQVLKSTIPRSVRVSEAPSYGQTVMTYDPGSPGALCYLEAAREIAVKGAPQ